MKIGIISPYPFPDGLAATNRIKAYSKALLLQGVDVTVIIPEPRENKENLKEYNCPYDSGCYDGINYIYPSGRYKNRYKILRALSIKTKYRSIRGFYKTVKYLLKNKDFDHIIISNDVPSYLWIYSQCAKLIKAKSIFIFDEYPTPIRHKLKSDIPFWKKFAYKKVLKNIDAYISITQNLLEYYKRFVNIPGYVLSIIVDFEKFSLKTSSKFRHIIYMGNMELSKDNVDLIIKAFAEISPDFPDYSLHLYGNPSEATKIILKDLIANLRMDNVVFMDGKISSDEVPYVLNSSSLLVSSQPATLRANGGFPTKLGEYLSTGIPVIMTDVGENSKELVDMHSCIFAKPNDVQDFADKMRWVLANYDKSVEIAERGKCFIRDKYSLEITGTKLKYFLETL